MSKQILVSAGHSTVPPKDSGAVGHGYTEAGLVVTLRDRVAQILRANGCTVLEDGADGESQPLTKAIALAHQAGVAVEFHFNAGGEGATGVEVLAKPTRKTLAQRLAKAVAEPTGLKLRGGEGGYRPDNSGQHHRLGFCEAGGLIVEVAFISNAGDLQAYFANFEQVAQNLAGVLATEAGVTVQPVGTAPTPVAAETYVVQRGDGLYALSRRFGVPVQTLVELNELDNPNDLPVGKRLRLK